MRIAFVNENSLGHASYLHPFAEELRRRPELGIDPLVIDATPLPPALEQFASRGIRGLRRWDLDFLSSRWRRTVSYHVRRTLEPLFARGEIEGALVNTQSVALSLAPMARARPLFVCADATFAQLARDGWFGRGPVARATRLLTLAPIRQRERAVFGEARRVIAWSEGVVRSLQADYGLPAERIVEIPPSLEMGAYARRTGTRSPGRPRLLFVGGDFRRKGGELLLAAFQQGLSADYDLHIVTQSDVPPAPHVQVHRGITRGSAPWRALWEDADLFVFPSTLETFGIVLVEALAFNLPFVSSVAGVAPELARKGAAARVLSSITPEALAAAVRELLPPGARRTPLEPLHPAALTAGYDLALNAERLAAVLREGALPRPSTLGAMPRDEVRAAV